MMLYVTDGMEINKKMWVCHCHWHQRNKSVKQIEGFKSNKYCCQQPKCFLRMDLDVHTALTAPLVEHTGGYENGIWRGIIKWQHGLDHRSNKSNVNMKIGEGHTCWGSNAFCSPVAHFKSSTFRSPKEAHLIFMADIFGHIYGSNLQTGSFGKAIDLMRCAACSTEPTSYPRKGKKKIQTKRTDLPLAGGTSIFHLTEFWASGSACALCLCLLCGADGEREWSRSSMEMW